MSLMKAVEVKQFKIKQHPLRRLNTIIMLSILGLAVISPPLAKVFAATYVDYSWTQDDRAGSWRRVASSADGMKLIAADYAGSLYTSTDGGSTWTERTSAGSHNWFSVASSSDGDKLIASTSDTVFSNGNWNNVGNLYTSVDGGATWVQRTSGGVGAWSSVASSADGSKLIASRAVSNVGSNTGSLYTSTDGGATWVERTAAGSHAWRSVASSSDGSKLVAVNDDYDDTNSVYISSLYTSTDGGVTWTYQSNAGARRWISVTSSGDGVKLAAVSHLGYVYTSTDGGTTWTERTGAGTNGWYFVTMSTDGTKLLLGGFHTDLYASTDDGGTWTSLSKYGDWFGAALSADGNRLVASADYLYTARVIVTITPPSNLSPPVSSHNNWTERTSAGLHDWNDIASSADGMKLIAADVHNYDCSGGFLYTSTDSGVTWTARASAEGRVWQSVASSADGTKLVAADTCGGDWNGGYLYTSPDSGVTWTEQTGSGKQPWVALASSVDGEKLVAAAYNGSVYTSDNSGVTWTERTDAGVRNWQAVTSSADGAKLVAVVGNGAIYTSSDGGASWHEQRGARSRNWSAVVSSADGTKLMAADRGGYLYISTDSGLNWVEQESLGTAAWFRLASSADGAKLITGAYGGLLYVSTDGGQTWASQDNPGSNYWDAFASSADGDKLFAGVWSGFIYSFDRQNAGASPVSPAPVPVSPPTPTAPNVPPTSSQVSVPSHAPVGLPARVAPAGETTAETQSTQPVEHLTDIARTLAYTSGRGVSATLAVGQGVHFEVANDSHTVTIDKVEAGRVTFTLRSTPQTVSLKVGETGKYDVNEDGKPDISVTLKGITDGEANLSFAAITSSPTAAQGASAPVSANKKPNVSPILLTAGGVLAGVALLSLAVRRIRRG